jgi:hypothetical protein
MMVMMVVVVMVAFCVCHRRGNKAHQQEHCDQ